MEALWFFPPQKNTIMSNQDNTTIGLADSGEGNPQFSNTESRADGVLNPRSAMNNTPISMNNIPNPNPVASPAVQRGDIPEMYLDAPAAAIQSDSPDNIIYENSFTMSQSSVGGGGMEPWTDTFTVPEGGAVAEASLDVDDWGQMIISGPGGPYKLELTPEVAGSSGPYGGHEMWGTSGTFDLW